MNSVVKLAHKDVNAIPFQEASLDIWDKKYRLTAKDGTPIDASMDDTFKRVARALADVERPEVKGDRVGGEVDHDGRVYRHAPRLPGGGAGGRVRATTGRCPRLPAMRRLRPG